MPPVPFEIFAPSNTLIRSNRYSTGSGNSKVCYEKVTNLTLGRQILGHWDGAAGYEWLVTNGMGGYACGPLALASSRRYHAFLMASLAPPVQRTLLVAKVDLCVEYLGQKTDLTANEFAGGAISPQGFVHLESFVVLEGIPTWRFAVADALLELQIFMAQGANTSYLRLELLRNTAPMGVTLKPYVAYRDYHSHGHGAQPFELTSGADQCCIRAAAPAQPYRLLVSQGRFAAAAAPYRGFWARDGGLRGLDASEDLFFPGSFSAELETRVPFFLIATAEPTPPVAGSEVVKSIYNDGKILASRLPKSAPNWIRSLARASDHVIVRPDAAGTAPASIIAG